ncbi:MAG: CHRD domain-containing protein [Actinomycetota bacterium]|nr:CHRD domain-containing protein [Actinomycetota bacterium]
MRTARAAAVIGSLAVAPLAFGVPAFAAEDGTYQVPLEQLNDSGATGTAMVELDGTKLHVTIEASGMVPNAPHAQHIHGDTTGKNFTCPTDADLKQFDKDENGVLSTTEGAAFYGPVHISLTTKGDTSAESGLAVDRFPTADADGNLRYERTITLDQATADNLTNLHIVQHGIDRNGNGKYDGKDKSDLNPDLPAEATDPADCGAVQVSQLQGAPRGGVETGGGTQSPSALPMYLLGSTALAGAAGALVLRRRSAGEQV